MKLRKSPVIKVWERILLRAGIIFRNIWKKQETVQSGTWYSLGKQKKGSRLQYCFLVENGKCLWHGPLSEYKKRKLTGSVAKTVSLTRSRIISTVSAVWDWWRWQAMSAVTIEAVWLKPPPPFCRSRLVVLQWWQNRTRWDRCHLYSHFHCLSHWFHHLVQRSKWNNMKDMGYSVSPSSLFPFHLVPQRGWPPWEWESVGGANFAKFPPVNHPNESHCDLIRWLNDLLKKEWTAGITESPQCPDAFDMKISKKSKRNKPITGISWDRKRLFFFLMLSAAQSTKTKESQCNGTDL